MLPAAFGLFVAVTTALVVLARRCNYLAYDLAASSPTCTLLAGEGGGTACFTVLPGCVPAHTARLLSPRWLADAMASGGPAWAWLPLLLLAATARSSRVSQAAALAVVTSAQLFALASMFFRYTWVHHWLSAGIDPSGHTFVHLFVALPLVAMWSRFRLSARDRDDDSHLPAWFTAASIALVVWVAYSSTLTASLFHGAVELAPPILLGAVLTWALDQVLGVALRVSSLEAWRTLAARNRLVVAIYAAALAFGAVAVQWASTANAAHRASDAAGGSREPYRGVSWSLFAAHVGFDVATLGLALLVSRVSVRASARYPS